jgi:hypothetical protein
VSRRAQPRLLVAVTLLLALPAAGIASTKDSAPPDREMLKMIEFLRQMEMIKQMDMLRDMQHLEEGAAPATPRQKAPTKKPETSK